jgi:hypothetical protein
MENKALEHYLFSEDRRMLRYPIALDHAERSEIFLPIDLRKEEADRVCAMIQALVRPT